MFSIYLYFVLIAVEDTFISVLILGLQSVGINIPSQSILIHLVLNLIMAACNFSLLKFFPKKSLATLNEYLDAQKYTHILIGVLVFLLGILAYFTKLDLNAKQFISLVRNDGTFLFLMSIMALMFIGAYLIFLQRQAHNEQRDRLLAEIERYANEMEELNGKFSTFKHDYINLLRSLRLAIENEDIEQIKKIFYQVLPPAEEVFDNKAELLRLDLIEDIAIKSLLSDLSLKALDLGIELILDIPEAIQLDRLADFHSIVRLLSIFYENAIVAAVLAAEPLISCHIFQTDDHYHFIIRNTYQANQVDAEQIFNKDYSTKAHSNNHGLGLYSAQQLLQQTEGFQLDTQHDEQFFSQHLTVKKPTNKS